MSKNKITDVTPLANLTKLETLYLSKNQISDIAQLDNLALSYNNLVLDDNPIVKKTSALCKLEIPPSISDKLSTNENLQINVNSSASNKLKPMFSTSDKTSATIKLQIYYYSELASVSTVIIAGSQYSVEETEIVSIERRDLTDEDLANISRLTNLKILILENCGISDISFIANLKNLVKISLFSNQISDLTPLAGLTNLKNLYLSKNQISDVTPLAGLTNLKTINEHLKKMHKK